MQCFLYKKIKIEQKWQKFDSGLFDKKILLTLFLARHFFSPFYWSGIVENHFYWIIRLLRSNFFIAFLFLANRMICIFPIKLFDMWGMFDGFSVLCGKIFCLMVIGVECILQFHFKWKCDWLNFGFKYYFASNWNTEK